MFDKTLRQLFCKHKNDRLRYLCTDGGTFYEPSRAKRKYVYECTRCGWHVIKDEPINCEGCSRLIIDKFGAPHCIASDNLKSLCLSDNRPFFIPKREVRRDSDGRAAEERD